MQRAQRIYEIVNRKVEYKSASIVQQVTYKCISLCPLVFSFVFFV